MRKVCQQQSRLDAILEKQAIQTLFQPVVSMRKRAVVGFEALSRGIDPATNKIIMPCELFAAAAISSQVVELDRLCREKALTNFRQILDVDDQALLFLNLDTSIIDKGVVGSGHLIQAAERMGLRPSSVVIEVIESRVDDIQALKTFISTYKGYGFLIALDDIGNGYSNLDRIFHVRPDIIKIDRCLVASIDQDYYKQELFKALVGLAKRIGALVVAEGVETKAEAAVCLEFGADMMQGYYFARPKPLPEALQESTDRKVELVVADYMKAKVDKIKTESFKNKTYEDILTAAVEELSNTQPKYLKRKLREMAKKYISLQSFYVLDMAGIQLTDTIETPSEADKRQHGIFQAAFKSADQSLKDYYIYIRAGLTRHITEPYMSLANGKLCVTGSAIFKDRLDNSYILCIDFNP